MAFRTGVFHGKSGGVTVFRPGTMIKAIFMSVMMKPMYANPALLTSTGGKYRGMPYLGLSETDIEKLVAYLLTLK